MDLFHPYDYYITPDEYAEAARNGISERNVNYRIRSYGWEKKMAITTPTMKFKNRTEIVEKSKILAIPYNVLMARIHLGWDEERATTTPVRDAEGLRANALRMCKMNRKIPRHLIELANENGIQYRSLTYRLRKGWDETRAATTPVSLSNGSMRVKELYGENYLKDWMSRLFPYRNSRKFNCDNE